LSGETHDYYGRQLKDWKSAETEQMQPDSPRTAGCAPGRSRTRARATGDRVAIAYLGSGDSFDRAILDFSDAYAVQNDRDYRALPAAAESGRIIAETGL
jgi:hypothetical protein